MKRFSGLLGALLLAGGLLSAAPVYAQADAPQSGSAQTDAPPPLPPGGGEGPHRGGPEHRVEMLQRALNLSSDQTAQVKTLFSAEQTKMEALRSNTGLSPDDRHSQMMSIHQDTNSKLRALLTPDQVTKLDAMQARMRAHRPGNGDGPPPPPDGGPGQS